jgi:hypothetical protein
MLAAVLLVCPSAASAAAPSEELLPIETLVFVSAVSLEKLTAASDQSDWATLVADPAAKGLADSLSAAVTKVRVELERRLGVTWKELEPAVRGEVAIALVRPKGQPAALVLFADASGGEQGAQAALAAAAKRLQSQGLKRTNLPRAGASVASFESAAAKGAAPQRRFHLLKDETIVAAESLAALDVVLAGWGKKDGARLADSPAFVAVMKAARSDEVAGQLRWFVDPFGYVDATTAPQPKGAKGRPTLMASLRAEGFDAIKGIGGVAGFTKSEYDLVQRIGIFAPPPYTKAMRAAKFSGPAMDKPPTWAPASATGCTSASWNVSNAFEYCTGLVDRLVFDGDMGVFDDTIDGVRDEPNGPRVDLRKKFVPALTDRVFVLSGLPAKPEGARPSIFSVQTADEAAVADMVKRIAEKNVDTKRIMVGDHIVWESVEGEGDPAQKKKPADENNSGPLNKFVATCVADGWLMLATDLEFLKTVLVPNGIRPLAEEESFLVVSGHLDQLGGKQAVVRRFAQPEQHVRGLQRTADALEITPGKPIGQSIVDSIRRPKKPAAATKSGEKSAPKPAPAAAVDAKVVRGHLGASGAVVETLEDGWLIKGFTLRHEKK